MQFRILEMTAAQVCSVEDNGVWFEIKRRSPLTNPFGDYKETYGKLQYRVSHVDPWRDVKVETENEMDHAKE